MQIKEGVDLRPLKPQMVLAAQVVESVFSERFKSEAIITCGAEGNHKEGSLHPDGYALDFRLWHISEYTPEERKARLYETIRQDVLTRLGAVYRGPGAPEGGQYDVVLESTPHLHVEFDPPA